MRDLDRRGAAVGMVVESQQPGTGPDLDDAVGLTYLARQDRNDVRQ